MTVVEARYSVKEYLAESKRLADAVIGVKAANGDAITAIGPNKDFSGLIARLAPAADEKQAVLALSPEALTARARAGFPALTSDMPITVIVGGPMNWSVVLPG
ncbi:hypothetical protein [Catenulispora sp. GAS73]|uniref:hypothetical protein n=1 Tax=Catenulispora sp. GAS73 TaxID=3156269 RepID=UPI0035128A68